MRYSHVRPYISSSWWWCIRRVNYLLTISETFVCDNDQHEQKTAKVCLLRNYNLINGTTLKCISHAILPVHVYSVGRPWANFKLNGKKNKFLRSTKLAATRTPPFITFEIESNENFQFAFVFFILIWKVGPRSKLVPNMFSICGDRTFTRLIYSA